MTTTPSPRRIAIACQGGGSHTAFTAGALRGIFRNLPETHEIVGMSGTSGGAICALLAWSCLLRNERDQAIDLLEAFWQDTSANFFYDMLLNNLVVLGSRLQDLVNLPAVNPYFYPPWGQDRLRLLLEKYVDFAQLPTYITPSSPTLLVGAVNVLSGELTIFRDGKIDAEAILASAAIPTLFRAVHTRGGVYWDGLFSHNPPIRDFVRSNAVAEAKPDEIWIIQINPSVRTEEPMTIQDIQDRRNELAGNLSLNQEVYFIERINQLIATGVISDANYKHVTIRRLMMQRSLDYASKLDRSPSFIQDLIANGEERARAFVQAL
jgi:NTE family protein